MGDDEGRGERIRARREALGMDVKSLAARSGIDRGTIAKIEDGGHARSATFGALEATLTRLEEEINGDDNHNAGGSDTVTYQLKGNFGVDVTLQGPVSNIAELEASIARLLGQMQGQRRGEDDAPER